MKKGKIKFSRLKNNRGVDIDAFRICHNAKNKAGDWQEIDGFPEEMQEMEFYFPFSKMENNIKISFMGYTNLPANGRGSREESYLVVSEGIGCPIVATPQGHSGKTYGVKDNILLTDEHLKKWGRVKKRMSLFLTPIGWAPNEYVVYSTTSEIAIETINQSYSELVDMLGTDLSLMPLSFKAFAISGKSKTGQNYRKFIGSIGAKRGLNGLLEGVIKAKQYREAFNVKKLEDDFERNGFFYEDDDDAIATPAVAPEGYTERKDNNTGEITYVNENGEVFETTAPSLDYGDLLAGFVSKPQATKIVSLAIELGKEDSIINISSPAQALSLLNKLQSEKNAA